VLFVVLPLRLESQDEAGRRAPGTPASAPENPRLKRRFAVTSAVAAAIWAIVAGIVLTGAVTVEDLDLFSRFGLGAAR